MQAGSRLTYPGGMEGWVDLVDLIAPEPGVEPATFRSRVRRSTTVPPRQPRWLVIQWTCNGLSTLATIIAEFSDNLSPNSATVAGFGDSQRIRRQSPFLATSRRFWRRSPVLATVESPNSATVGVFGDSRRIRRQSPFSATVAELGDYSRQCGQGLTITLCLKPCPHWRL